MNNIDILVEVFKRFSNEDMYEFVSVMSASAPKVLETIIFNAAVVELEKKYSIEH